MKLRHAISPALLAVACGVNDPDQGCPDVDTADLDCPVQLGEFEISTCEAVPDGPALPTDITAAVAASTLRVELGGVLFRDDNEVCGFAQRQNDDVRVLLQPCVLIPEGGVSSGDCWYESLVFTIAGVDLSGAQSVTIFHRVDRPVEFPPYTPEKLASASLD